MYIKKGIQKNCNTADWSNGEGGGGGGGVQLDVDPK